MSARRAHTSGIRRSITRESSIYVGARFCFIDAHVAQGLHEVRGARGLPQSLRADNGPEFTSVALDQWAYWNHVRLNFSRPGRPTDNAVIESLNALLRQERLNVHWFESLGDINPFIHIWRQTYNEHHPHSSLGNLTPNEFAHRSPRRAPTR